MRFWNRTVRDGLEETNWSSLLKCRYKGVLLAKLQSEAIRYTPDDLDIMMLHYDYKIKDLPHTYREELRKYARIQITEGYNKLVTVELDAIRRKEKLDSSWRSFVLFVLGEVKTGNHRLRCLKYLIAAYDIFIEEKPPHPIGMPFPGGSRVEMFEGVYYCPVKEVWTENASALCTYCPAVQSRERDLLLSKRQRDEMGKKEKISNYFYNFKG